MHEPIEDFGELIEESTLLDVRLDRRAARVALQVGILAHPMPPSGQKPLVWLAFRRVGRLAGWLREVEYFDAPTEAQPWAMGIRDLDPPVDVAGDEDLLDWLLRFRGDLNGQAYPQFDLPDPQWLARTSFDLAWPGGVQHAVDIGFDATPATGQRFLDLRLWFGEVTVLGQEGEELDATAVIESVKDWWRGFSNGANSGQYGFVKAGR